jgi:hypothetical protein
MANYTSNLIPTMTSNTAPSGVVNTSGSRSGYYPYSAFDKNNTTMWASDSPVCWILYQFTTSKKICKYTMRSYDITSTDTPKSWTFEGSNNGSAWTVLDTQSNVTSWASGVKKEFPFTNTTGYTYYRINISANNGNTNFTSITEIEMMEVTFSTLYLIQDKNNILSSVIDVGANNLIANYKFSETSGTTCVDSKGTYSGTYTGTTSVVGTVGNTRSFNGTSDYISFNSIVIPQGKKTIRLKVKVNGLPSVYGCFLENRSAGGISVGVYSDKKLTVYMSCSSTTVTLQSPILNNIDDKNFHDVMVTFTGDATPNGLKLYFDDMVNPIATTTCPSIDLVGDKSLTIGASYIHNQYLFNGALDEVEIYNDVVLFDSNGNRCVEVDNLNNTLSDTLFLNKGMVDPTIVNNKTSITKGIYGKDNGTLGTGKYFEFSLDSVFKTVKNIT